MIRPFLILASVILFLGGAAWLFLVYLPSKNTPKEGDACKTTLGKDGKITNGACVESAATGNGNSNGNGNVNPIPAELTVPLGFRSTLVNKSDVTAAPSPSTLTEGALQAVQGELPKSAIHYATQFSDSCYNFIWYHSNLYVYQGSKTDATTGIKNCYYRFVKGVLPGTSRINIGLQPTPCTNFKMYIGNVSYSYVNQTHTTGINPVYFCNYKKD